MNSRLPKGYILLELARHTGLSSGATTAILDQLEKSELIER